jgi:8-oxo-dGTP pyrophosphatase MutT (NUDIX family)
MTEIRVGVVDVYVIWANATGDWRILLLRRSESTRCPGAWEAVHGRIEPGEVPKDAAIREVREETGLEVSRLYNVTVQPFYLHSSNTVQMAVVFAAFVESETIRLGAEHREYSWLDVATALETFAWPREAAALRDIVALLHDGDAGPVEDVLRVI